MDRYAEVTRKTGETDIVVKLDLDGSGAVSYTHLTLPTTSRV